MTEDNSTIPGSNPEEPQAQQDATTPVQYAPPTGAASAPVAQAPAQNPYEQAQTQQTAQQPTAYGTPVQQPTAYGTPTQQYAPQGVAPQAYAAAPAAAGSGKAMAALLCGIGAIVFSGTVIVGIVLGVIAIILAGQYIKTFGKEGKANAGKITGIIGIVLSVLALIAYIFTFVIIGVAISEYDSSSNYDYSYTYPDTDSSTPDSGSGSGSGSSNSGGLSVYGDTADVESLTAAVEAEIEKYQNPDEATLQEIADGVDTYFTEIADASLASYGIDSKEIAKKMAASLTVELESISAYSDNGTVSGTMTSITMNDLLEAVSNVMEEHEDYSLEQAFQEAVQVMEPSEDPYFMMDFDRSGDTWTPEDSSYNDPLAVFFGIYQGF